MIDEAIYEVTKIKLKKYEKEKDKKIIMSYNELFNLIIKILKLIKKY